MFIMTQRPKLGAGAAKAFSVEYIGLHHSTTAGTSHTFSGIDIGDPDENRTVCVFAYTSGGSNANITTATLGGNYMTLQDDFRRDAGTDTAGAVFTYDIAAGESADLVVSGDFSMSNMQVMVFVVYKATLTAANGAFGVSTATVNTNTVTDGILIVVGTSSFPTSATVRVTITGATKLFETTSETTREMGYAAEVVSSGATPQSLSVSSVGGGVAGGLVLSFDEAA